MEVAVTRMLLLWCRRKAYDGAISATEQSALRSHRFAWVQATVHFFTAPASYIVVNAGVVRLTAPRQAHPAPWSLFLAHPSLANGPRQAVMDLEALHESHHQALGFRALP